MWLTYICALLSLHAALGQQSPLFGTDLTPSFKAKTNLHNPSTEFQQFKSAHTLNAQDFGSTEFSKSVPNFQRDGIGHFKSLPKPISNYKPHVDHFPLKRHPPVVTESMFRGQTNTTNRKEIGNSSTQTQLTQIPNHNSHQKQTNPQPQHSFDVRLAVFITSLLVILGFIFCPRVSCPLLRPIGVFGQWCWKACIKLLFNSQETVQLSQPNKNRYEADTDSDVIDAPTSLTEIGVMGGEVEMQEKAGQSVDTGKDGTEIRDAQK